MLSVYPACFFKDDQGYSVVFPDLGWLATSGKTQKDAMNKAVDCLAGYLYFLKKEGEEEPAASEMIEISIDQVAKELDADTVGAFVNLVSVDVEDYAQKHFEKSVRKNLTIPAWLNYAALERNLNFSQVLQEALIEKIREG